jgi:hypothetical protein
MARLTASPRSTWVGSPSYLPVGRDELASDVFLVRVGDGRLQAQFHPGERGPQLVRRVRHELTLRADGALEAVGHLVEGPPELLDLPGPTHCARPRREVSRAQSSGRSGEPCQRSSKRPRKPERQQEARDERREADRQQSDRDVADVVVHPLDVLREAEDPHLPPVVDDRDGRGHDVMAEVVAVADLRIELAVQRRLDLRPSRAAEVQPHVGRPVRVGDQDAAVVHDDDAVADDRRRLVHDRGQRLFVSDVLVADRRRDALS